MPRRKMIKAKTEEELDNEANSLVALALYATIRTAFATRQYGAHLLIGEVMYRLACELTDEQQEKVTKNLGVPFDGPFLAREVWEQSTSDEWREENMWRLDELKRRVKKGNLHPGHPIHQMIKWLEYEGEID